MQREAGVLKHVRVLGTLHTVPKIGFQNALGSWGSTREEQLALGSCQSTLLSCSPNHNPVHICIRKTIDFYKNRGCA